MKPRVPKSELGRIVAVEDHLYLLADALRTYHSLGETVRIKQIAAELRVLVCRSGHNKPILLDVMKEHGFAYNVEPTNEPFRTPIQLVSRATTDDDARLSAQFEAAGGDLSRIRELVAKRAALAKPLPLEQVVNDGLAVYIAPYEYSFRELTLAIAQQMGSSHEDASVDEALVKAMDIMVGGHAGHYVALLPFANEVCRAGVAFLQYVVNTKGYEPQHFRRLIKMALEDPPTASA